MQKRPSSPARGSSRVDAILRYRSASEGVLCTARCRELSRSGLTATIDRPVFPGELLRFELEPPPGGPSVLGLARVAWTGTDPEGAPGTQVMRMRFLALGDASETALLAWLDELSAVADRPSSPHDDSSVRELSRAIADSLLPPPPVLPGAPPSSEASGLSPAPIAVPNRPSIPPPPGMYSRAAGTLSHPIEHIDPSAHDFGASAAAVPAPDRSSAEPPLLPSQRAASVAAVRPLRASPAMRRTADVRERLSRLQRRRDQTPLVVPLDVRTLNEPPLSAAPVARITLSPPLPLGALINAPAETTRRSSPPPPGPVPPPEDASPSSSSWPALRVPAAVAAIAPPSDESPAPPRRSTIPPPASIPEMPPLRVSSPPLAEPERASLPIDGPSLPLSDAPWSVPAPPAQRLRLAHPWLALGLGSLALGAALAYLAYGPALVQRVGLPEVAAVSTEPAGSVAPGTLGTQEAIEQDRAVAAVMAVPAEPSADMLNALEPQAQPFRPVGPVHVQRPKVGPSPVSPAPKPVTPVLPAPVPAAAAPIQPLPSANAAPGVVPAPPPPTLPAALAAPAAPSKVDRARACLARGDNECAAKLLKGASSEAELELWIETLRAQGRALEARRDMQRFVDSYPEGRRTAVYRRILSNAP